MRGPASTALWIATALALLYACARFAASGVQYPLSHPNLGQVEEELRPLRDHLETGAPVTTNNPRQYGATFFFVAHPLLVATNGDPVRLARALYAVQLVSLAAAFAFTALTLRHVFGASPYWPLIFAWMAIYWLTCTPLYVIMTVKNVETWELALLAAGLYCYVRGWLWAAGLAIAAAGLAKLLPFIFIYYLLLRDRRAFAYSVAGLAALLAVAHAIYGPRMGLMYLPSSAGSAVGESWALDWHENVAVKAAFDKLFGHLDNPLLVPPEYFKTHSGVGYIVQLSPAQAAISRPLGLLAQIACGAWLTWACLRGWRGGDGPQRTLWEWSLVAAMLLVVSPSAAFEYSVLTLGAASYVIARLFLAPRFDSRRVATFAAAAFFLGVFLPRSLLTKLTLVDVITKWTGYTHFTPGEAYQYYDFPLLGLILLVVSVWQHRTPAIQAGHAAP